jgi:chemotaxis protein CheY-P-specific phosphatase CheC
MKLEPEVLADVAQKATQSSSRALSVLVGEEVTVKTTQASYLSLDSLADLVTSQEGMNIVAFSQLISGIKGAALLIMGHEDSLHLVDALLQKPLGTTKVLGDMEKSAIKETLNILSNSQITSLTKNLGVTINVMPPNLITQEHVASVLDYLAAQQGEEAKVVAFETSLITTGQTCQVTMFLVFDAELANIIAQQEQA